MTLTLEAIQVPLTDDGHGGLRVGTTRVQLESVLGCLDRGETAEQIVQAFDTLDLADVYAVLAWVLRHPAEVSAYRERREREAGEVRQKLEADGVSPSPERLAELRAQLQARWAARQETQDAPPAQ